MGDIHLEEVERQLNRISIGNFQGNELIADSINRLTQEIINSRELLSEDLNKIYQILEDK